MEKQLHRINKLLSFLWVWNIPLKLDTAELILGRNAFGIGQGGRCVEKRAAAGGETSQALGTQGLGVKGPVPHILATCQE